MPINYEAIGRCKVLNDEITRLMQMRSSKLSTLSEKMASAADYQSFRFTVPTVNTEAISREINEIELINARLRQQAEEHNVWADAAEVQAMTFE